MTKHTSLGDNPFKRSRRLKLLLDKGEISLAGNSKLKIYGTLLCSSGKRMKTENRIFFSSENEALEWGYRPCGHCMREEYKHWKERQLTIMTKKVIVLAAFVLTSFAARAQSPSADSVYSWYLDFNLARFQGEQDKVLQLGENILPYADKLPDKARTSFYFSVGKMYEDNDQPDRALPFYQKVAIAVPDYYVVHRALGYIYLEKSKTLRTKLDAALADKAATAQLSADYIALVKKALSHLEKAQACDPSDETLEIIKALYKNINDDQGLNTLDSRLKDLSTNCIDILNDR